MQPANKSSNPSLKSTRGGIPAFSQTGNISQQTSLTKLQPAQMAALATQNKYNRSNHKSFAGATS